MRLYPCNYVWAKKSIKHEWQEGKAGGCRNNADTWLKNPIIGLTMQEPGDVVLLLSQEDMTKSIGLYIIRRKDPSKEFTNSNVVLVNKSVFGKNNEVNLAVSLAKGEYGVVACTFNKGETGPFAITCYCSISDFDFEAANFVPLSGGEQLHDTPVGLKAKPSSASSKVL